MANVKVSIVVEVDDETHTVEVTASTDGRPAHLAEALLSSAKGDMAHWLRFGESR